MRDEEGEKRKILVQYKRPKKWRKRPRGKEERREIALVGPRVGEIIISIAL